MTFATAVPQNNRRILCFGGSFNPPHHGHLITARSVAERYGFSRVRLMVAARPPHKPDDASIIDAAHRVAMCRLAVEGDPLFEVDDREIRRPGPSYTIDTARSLQLQPAFAGAPVDWLIGADLLTGLTRWRETDALLTGTIVRFIVMRRPGHDIDWHALPPAVGALRDRVVEAPAIDISATDIRDRVRAGRDARYLVPEAVRQYIERHALYR